MKVVTDADGNSTVTATLTVNGNAFSGSFNEELTYNKATLSYRYKAEDDANYSEWQTVETNPTLNNNKYSATIEVTGLNYQKAYTFQVGIADLLYEFFELGKKTSRAVTNKAIPVFDWSAEDFNFNVPVTMQGLSLGGLVKSMTEAYPLTVTFERGDNWTTGQYENVSATLIGNMIRFNYFLYRSSATGDGNLTNEEVCTITFTHNGKIKNAYETSFSSGSTGSVATFGTSNMAKVKDENGNETDSITFKVNLAATGGAASQFSGYFYVPVTLNL